MAKVTALTSDAGVSGGRVRRTSSASTSVGVSGRATIERTARRANSVVLIAGTLSVGLGSGRASQAAD